MKLHSDGTELPDRPCCSLDSANDARRVAERGLHNVAGYLRREVSRRLHLRTSPQLRFMFDDSLERGQRIETLLRRWHEEDPSGPPPAGDEEDARE